MMNFPFELPTVFDEGTFSESGDDSVPARLSERVKAGADAVCVCCADLFRAAEDTVGNVPVGGILGPSGISPSPAGGHGFDSACAFYREQVCAFGDAGARFLLLDRQTSLADMRAALLAAKGKGIPVLACLAADRGTEEHSFLPALITLQAMGVSAVGLCGVPDKPLLTAVRHAMPHASVPLVAVADAVPGQTAVEFEEAVRPLLNAGLRMIGCGRNTSPEHLHALWKSIKKYGPPEISEEPDCYAAATEREAFFLGNDIEFSKPLPCSGSLVDKLIDLDDEQISAALVRVESIDDAVLLGKCASMSKLPIAVRADSATVLDAALRYFQGRLIVDSGSCIEREVLEPLAAKYGAVVY